MAVINLRDVPDDLARMVKATAASEGLTLREFVLGVLERDMRRGGWTAGKAPDVKTDLPVLPPVPDISIESLRDIAAGKIKLCGFRVFNDTERAWYACRTAKGHKGKHDLVATGEEVD